MRSVDQEPIALAQTVKVFSPRHKVRGGGVWGDKVNTTILDHNNFTMRRKTCAKNIPQRNEDVNFQCKKVTQTDDS